MKTLQRMNATKPAAAHSSAHALGVLAVLALALCLTMVTPVIVSAADAPLQISVSIPPQKYFVERIGGDLVRTTVMVPPGADPHTYEPKPSQLRGLSGSRIYFSIGAPFEDAWLARIVAAAGPSLSVVPMHKGVTLLPAAAPLHSDEAEHAEGKEHHEDHHAHADGHGHDHGTTDPHVWLSPMLVRHMSLAIRDALAKADPAHAATYRANYDRFAADIDAMDKKFADLFAALPQDRRRFLVFHPSWNYFAHNYGLTELSIEVEGREPSPRQLRAIIDLARRERITTIFVQPQFSRRAAQTIATEIGARLVDADPLAEDWAANLERTAKALAQATGR
ncbi:metal ABC transporter solute-binding protein, Zn/Mn family [Nitratidesulfovibrio vulgaris]|uniref:Cation ABC transporter, periplasmc-binding protein n=1 Tax=Nitratidesulfovibrio vulgaris (strain ATCC 29579 / DSM 644 / CCUG 34227 / NCIMB 8303 / VKM B-1760 / Hildenborough) TaxID=882 RepID=Q72CE0_NITV2|nr:zinc ABC transporter substrate-binding protein [Nitratidesulfovibrio vulgaris]AAS95821.1 cation ABC transporter, periplasmc-binding protein [Nitratidesulfovibrio vulgaris str. Hildenborough]ADP86399.1 periplasmic solute binding protein [Nitratidesulfovibrio vulgaris RCH1]